MKNIEFLGFKKVFEKNYDLVNTETNTQYEKMRKTIYIRKNLIDKKKYKMKLLMV